MRAVAAIAGPAPAAPIAGRAGSRRSTTGLASGLALALVLGMALAPGCSHAEAPPPVAPRGPTACERAADSMVGAMLSRLPAADAPTEQADALRRLIRVRCEQDGWSAEATRCLIAMQKLDDAAPCARLLTDDQQAALVRDQAGADGGGGASARPGGSGGPGPSAGPGGAGSGQPGVR